MWLKLLLVLCVATLVTAFDENPRIRHKSRASLKEKSISKFKDPEFGIEYRLPNDTKPIHYDITLRTDIHNGDFEFSGTVMINIQAVNKAAEIVLHYRYLVIRNVVLYNAGGVLQADVPFQYKDDVEFMVITPTIPLNPGNYQVVINYSGQLRDDNAGFYRSSYVNEFGDTVWLATTQFDETDARHAFPW